MIKSCKIFLREKYTYKRKFLYWKNILYIYIRNFFTLKEIVFTTHVCTLPLFVYLFFVSFI